MICPAVTCTSLAPVSGGEVTLVVSGGTTLAQFSCHSQRALYGQDVLTCRDDGTWDFSQPICGRQTILSLTMTPKKQGPFSQMFPLCTFINIFPKYKTGTQLIIYKCNLPLK